jgi:N6-L-threonylcarbamoyladenine synthase
LDDSDKALVAAGFQAAVIEVLTVKLIRAARNRDCKAIGVAGGVSANQTFIKSLAKQAGDHGIEVFSPPLSLCGDNAAMIAARGFTMIQNGHWCGPDQDVYSRVRT